MGNHLGWVVTHNHQEWSLYFPTANPRDRSHSVSNFHLISNKTRNWFGNLFWRTAAGSKIKNTFLKKRTNIPRFFRIFLKSQSINPQLRIEPARQTIPAAPAEAVEAAVNCPCRLVSESLRAPSLSYIVFGYLWIPCCIAWSAWSSGVTIWVPLVPRWGRVLNHGRASLHPFKGYKSPAQYVRAASSCPSTVVRLAWFESMSQPMLKAKSLCTCARWLALRTTWYSKHWCLRIIIYWYWNWDCFAKDCFTSSHQVLSIVWRLPNSSQQHT